MLVPGPVAEGHHAQVVEAQPRLATPGRAGYDGAALPAESAPMADPHAATRTDDPAPPQRPPAGEESLFVAALGLPAAARAAFLDRACDGDAGLRARVGRLLAADDRPPGILDSAPPTAVLDPPGAVPGGTLPTVLVSPHLTPGTAVYYAGPGPGPGTVLGGKYTLVEPIGEGGMGAVWVADQTEPVKRRVAVKLVRAGMDSRAVLARFEAERQALALMDHPHIAKVLDAGATPDGRPFFVMELVEGVPITRFCDDRRLPVRQRLELFVPVCRAVQHAHQKGVIHRDLKPSNVLVGEADGRPAPKVIDFGIAKAAGAKLTDETVHTGFGAILGTPEYMAPEQAGGSADVDTRADVYALGVLLYELLAGDPPIRLAGDGTAGLLDLLRAVREDEPPAPSRRAAAADPAVAEARGTDPRRLPAALRGDLDRVALKALEKDRARRYDTAAGLARDVERYLAGEPVTARPVDRVERLVRWARRNPVVAGLGAAVAALVLTVAVGATAFAVRLRDALAESEGARDRLAAAQKDTRRQLWRTQLNRAEAITQSNLPGQRTAGLALIREALATARETGLADDDRRAFRDVAAAALGLPDLEVVREWDGDPSGARHLAADAGLDRYARPDPGGVVSVRRVADDRELVRIPGAGPAPRLTLSGDGRLLAVVDEGGSGRVYRMDGPGPERLLATPMDAHQTPRFTPGGGLVYTAGGSVRAWDRATGRVRSWPLPGKLWGGSALSPDGRLFAVGCDRGGQAAVVHVRDIESGEAAPDRPLPGAAEGLAWHPDGRTLAVYAARRIRLWDVPAGREVGVLDGHRTEGGVVAFAAGGDRLVSNDWSGLLRVWDWRAGRQLLALPAGSRRDDGVAAADGRHLFARGPTQPTLRVVRFDPGRERRPLGRPHPAGGEALADPAGRFVLVGGASGAAALDPQTGEERGRLPGPARAFHLTPAGDLLTTGPDGPLRWPRADDPAAGVTRFGPPQWIGPAGAGAAETHGASADGRVVAVPNLWAGAVVLHRDPPGVPAPTGPQDYVRTCAVSPDGRWAATGSHDCPSGIGAKVWDARTGNLVREFPVPGLCAVGFSPDGRWLATAGGGLRVWRVGTWDEGPPVPDAAAAVGWAFAPDGGTLAVGGHGAVRLVRSADGAELVRLPLPGQGKFTPRCFSPDGGRLYVTDLETGGVVVWDLRLLRQGLVELGLDWDAPPLPPAPPPAGPWRVEFVGTDRAGRLWDATVKAAWADPTDSDVRTRLAALSGDPGTALTHATLAVGLRPDRADARYYRARANLLLRRYDEAAADATIVLQAVPGHRDAGRIRDAAEAAMRTAPPPRPVKRPSGPAK